MPFEALQALGLKSYDRAPRRPSTAASVFWSAPGVPPSFALLPRVIRLTAYRSVGPAELPGFLAAAAAHPWLQELSILHGGLTDLPGTIGQLHGLYELSLEQNELRQVPPALGTLPLLESLDLSGNPVETLPAELGQLHKLRALYLGGAGYAPAPLPSLPPSLAGLPALSKLSLDSVPQLSTSLGGLRQLATLALHGQVTRAGLPPELGELTGLTSLALAYSTLSALPGAVRGLRGLQTLYLTNGDFSSLPPWLPELTRLSYLAVFGSPKLDPRELASLVAHMPAMRRLFVWHKFPPEGRKLLQKIGFITRRSNPSVMERDGGESLDDPFPEIR